MSGHSKWSTIKHKKAKTDAARGKVFTKIIREIMIAAKIGGGDVEANARLRLAVDKGRQANMPNDTIERAIAKATGEGAAPSHEVTYEGYGPAGVAILVDAMTDNKQRTVAEVRNAFLKGGGNMGESGCVGWMFKKKGSILYDKKGIDEEALSMEAIDAGAEDILLEPSVVEVVTRPGELLKVRDALEKKGFKSSHSEVTMVPESTVKVEGEDAQKVLKLVNSLEDLEDVQAVHANFDISDEILEKSS